MSDHRILVLGLGNPVLTDDAVGIRLAEDLQRTLGDVAALEIRPVEGTWGLDLLHVLAGREEVVLLDSLKTWHVEPGYWCHLTLAGLRHTRYACHVHDLNLVTIVDLGRRIGIPLPFDSHIHVFGVAVGEASTFGTSLSPALTAAYPKLLIEIERDLRAMAEPVLSVM